MLSSPEYRTNCESRGRRINPFETETARSGQRKTRVTSYHHPLSHNHLHVRGSSGLINPCVPPVYFSLPPFFFPGRVLYLWNKLADISVALVLQIKIDIETVVDIKSEERAILSLNI